ncbi:outer membrane protein assembly factor BamB family protein [Salinigranum halophilum]|uniref:outer membrane protein assembly factor BamB family protein n=1 Tax=Salinigranum halophilum TaxID=2565931 RepID=UPI00115D8F24|nr:PQQ-binding-like beta-propeller repeat protein [Salinigranum halophilum]
MTRGDNNSSGLRPIEPGDFVYLSLTEVEIRDGEVHTNEGLGSIDTYGVLVGAGELPVVLERSLVGTQVGHEAGIEFESRSVLVDPVTEEEHWVPVDEVTGIGEVTSTISDIPSEEVATRLEDGGIKSAWHLVIADPERFTDVFLLDKSRVQELRTAAKDVLADRRLLSYEVVEVYSWHERTDEGRPSGITAGGQTSPTSDPTVIKTDILDGGDPEGGADTTATAAATGTDGPEDWPMFRGGPARSGANPSVQRSPAPTCNIDWQFDTSGSVVSSPAVARGTVFVGSQNGRLYALDTADGTELWTADLGSGIRSSPAVADETVIVGCTGTNETIYALSTVDGTVQWSLDAGEIVSSSPAVVDGTVYIGTNRNAVSALSVEDGTTHWTADVGGNVRSSPAVVDDTVYFGSDDRYVYAVSAADGSEQWRTRTDGKIYATPAVVDSTVYVGSSDGGIYALYPGDGDRLWQFRTNAEVMSSPAVANDTVFAGSYDGTLYALSSQRGKVRWQFDTDHWIRSSPTVVDGTVYIGCNDYGIHAFGAETGDRRWRIGTGARVYSSPAVADGTVYIGSHDGCVYALR